MTRLRICIAGRNHAAWTKECLMSVLAQTTHGEGVIDWTDDFSDTQDAFLIASTLLHEPHHAWRTHHRRGGLENLWRSIRAAKDDEVCVLMGGDGDELLPGALERIRLEYDDPECWATYGQLRNTSGPAEFCAHEWVKGSDPRDQMFVWAPFTVRAKLAKKVLEDDLKMNGFFFPASGDVALNIPCIEMAGHDRVRFIPDVWYSRHIHAGNDHNAAGRLQDFCTFMALAKPRYARLASIDDAPVRTDHVLRASLLLPARDSRGSFVAF